MKKTKGFSLVEVMVVVMIMGLFFLVVSAPFYHFVKGIFVTKSRVIAINLAQEKIELLKNIAYKRLLVTKDSDIPENNADPGNTVSYYDTRGYEPYAKEEFVVGDIPFTRQILIYKVYESGGNITIETTPDTTPDTGLKKIIVTVLWQEGAATRSLSLTNLRDDSDRVPLSGKIYGTITTTPTVVSPAVPTTPSPNGALGSARVVVLENPVWETYTATNGSYEISLATGDWSLWVSKQGYWDFYSEKITVAKGEQKLKHIQLTQKLTGTVTGFICYNDHLLISQVVPATAGPSGLYQEYVELYNPTTYPIRLGSGAAAWDYGLKYVDASDDVHEIGFNNTDPIQGAALVTVPSYGFAVIANTPTITIGGTVTLADACFSPAGMAAGYPDVTYGYIQAREKGGISLWSHEGGLFSREIDRVGWSDSQGMGHVPPAIAYEGSYIVGANNAFPDPGKTILRQAVFNMTQTYPGTWDGPAHDSNNNAGDFQTVASITTTETGWAPKPRNTASTIRLPMGGTPAMGAIITCNDGLSSATTAYSMRYGHLAYFELRAATGTWTVFISKDNYCMTVSSVIVTANKGTSICNAATNPAWPVSYKDFPTIILSSTTEGGYIAGRITCGGTPLNNIKVSASGLNSYTNLAGIYGLYTPAPGPFQVTANPYPDDGNNSLYSTETSSCTVEAGRMTLENFNLSQGGRMYSWATANGTDPLPNTVIELTKGPITYTEGTGDDGRAWFLNIDTGTWHAEVILEPGETAVPKSVNATLTLGQTVFLATFTISGLYGHIVGTVKENGKLIQTGVMLLATTGTMDLADPPTVDAALRAGEMTYFGTVSKSDGTYELPVQGGYSYNVYAWYTKVQRARVLLYTDDAVTSTPVVSGGEANLDFEWTIP